MNAIILNFENCDSKKIAISNVLSFSYKNRKRLKWFLYKRRKNFDCTFCSLVLSPQANVEHIPFGLNEYKTKLFPYIIKKSLVSIDIIKDGVIVKTLRLPTRFLNGIDILQSKKCDTFGKLYISCVRRC